MRKLAGAIVVVAVLVGSAGTSGAAMQPTYVTKCNHTAIKPKAIVFACADGGYYATRLHWGFWGTVHARGRGLFHENDCTPDCADGHFHTRRGHIRLSGRKWCSNVKRWVFRAYLVHYRRPLLGRSEDSGTFPCPF